MWAVYSIGTLSIIVFSFVAVAGWKRSSMNPWETMGLWLDRGAVIDMLAGFVIGALVITGIFFVEWRSA